jgi:hypothetical protein
MSDQPPFHIATLTTPQTGDLVYVRCDCDIGVDHDVERSR